MICLGMMSGTVVARPSADLGFRIEKFLELQGWKTIDIDESVPLVSRPSCPADGRELRTLCTLFSDSAGVSLRIGCCPACGHVTYIDRPTKTWIDHFYREVWDGADSGDLEKEIVKRRHKLLRQLGREKEAVALAKMLRVDRSRTVCEIGCGDGRSLQQLRHAGFSQLIGVEASTHRAAIARESFGLDVYTSPFEASQTYVHLKARAPFGIIYSYHVLEHTYEPQEVIAAASRLQENGDYLIICVPNHQGEPSMGVLMFLPHLHSFTRASLANLLRRHGYEVASEEMNTRDNLNMVFRKSAVTDTDITAPGAFDEAVAKHVRTLQLHRPRSGRRRLWWLKGLDVAGYRRMLGGGPLEKLHWDTVATLRRYDRPRSIVVNTLLARRTSLEDSPLEIEFAGKLRLFYK